MLDKGVALWYYTLAPAKTGVKRTLKIKQRRTNKDPTILKRNQKKSRTKEMRQHLEKMS